MLLVYIWLRRLTGGLPLNLIILVRGLGARFGEFMLPSRFLFCFGWLCMIVYRPMCFELDEVWPVLSFVLSVGFYLRPVFIVLEIVAWLEFCGARWAFTYSKIFVS